MRFRSLVFVLISISAPVVMADVFNMPDGQTSLETVPVGNAGNAADSRYGGYGSVGYTYNVGKYEVTAGQYTAFLNAVAKTDAYGLYNANMWSSTWGCKIQRSGSSGSYSYSVASDYANRPVNYVSWGDSARFANWLHNGQGSGDTEAGAYTLNGAMTDAQLLAVNRNSNWKWAITSEDEWYKAAYHKNDGVTGNYWDYPTSSDNMPSNVLSNPTDPGNNATYAVWKDSQWVYTIGSPYWRTEVGAHENSDSPYGTFDQGGNVWEWNEAVLYGSHRGFRGGSYDNYGSSLIASVAPYAYPTSEGDAIGFRVSEVSDPKPHVTTFSINNGASFTTSRTVTLDNFCLNDPTEYIASESASFAGATWQSYSSTPSFTLSPDNGTKTVYFKARNAYGESVVANDTILLDDPTPKINMFAINSGAATTTVRTIVLNNSFSSSPTHYMASESATFTGATWKIYAVAPVFTISAGNGIKIVYLKVKNAYGESSVASDTIISQVACNRPLMDSNGDLYVDAIDFDMFSACYNGPTNLVSSDCLCVDTNGDQYVDGIDFDVFSGCYNGPTNPARC